MSRMMLTGTKKRGVQSAGRRQAEVPFFSSSFPEAL
jgi:hypothetical protein